ncbi:Cytochrome P450 107B1 [Nocardia otitidiscaviarum]|uniref:Cytochrome P450 107B1 n=1 Tax=Nocardia otitidiscaviarum TaxID=1823 RepID=A0A379JLT1_9NOCA|nr:cytochrome P450 [Nocardia otitidiscaviarum]SUD49562.1 Cytochrome P450 107B1 [Nocardia otitidiscaviarum]
MDTHTTPLVLDPAGTDIQGEIARIRERGPVTLVELPGGVRAWSITDADILRNVLASPAVSKNPREHWPAFRNGDIPENWPLANWVNTYSMFTAHGSDHRRLRKVVAAAFTHGRTAQLRPRIEQIVKELLATLETAPAGRVVDLREEFAYPLPIRVIGELLGVPDDLSAPLRACVDSVFDTGVTQEQAVATHTRMIGLLQDLVAYRREHPGEDMTSMLIGAVDDPDTDFTVDEAVGTLYLTVNAGHETTVSLLDHTIHLLLTHPDHRAAAIEGRLDWGIVIEEALRVESPAAHVPLRYAVTDLELGGVTIAAGDPILVCYAGASRDPQVHGETADEFDPTRATADKHLAFGYGAHHCLGAPLARLEAQVAIPAIFARFPNMALAAGEDPGTTPGFISNGHLHLPVVLGR